LTKAKGRAEEQVPGSPLCPGIHAIAILLISPSDGDKLNPFQEMGVIVWYDAAGAVSEDNIKEFERLGLSGALGTDNLAWPSGKKESGDEEINSVVDRASFWSPHRS
jgi:hypothetical protein